MRMYTRGRPAVGVTASHLLRLLAFMQIGAGQQQPLDTRRLRARNHLVVIAGKLRAGQIYANIKHHNSHMTTALTGG